MRAVEGKDGESWWVNRKTREDVHRAWEGNTETAIDIALFLVQSCANICSPRHPCVHLIQGRIPRGDSHGHGHLCCILTILALLAVWGDLTFQQTQEDTEKPPGRSSIMYISSLLHKGVPMAQPLTTTTVSRASPPPPQLLGHLSPTGRCQAPPVW